MVDRGGLISVSDLLLWEENRSAVLEYFAGNFPGVTASSLRSRFKAKNFDGSSSNADKADGGTEVNQPQPKKKGIVFKKRKSESVNADEVLVKDNSLQLEDLSNFTKMQEKLHVFEEEGESGSVWSKKFPFSVVADEIVQTVSDISRVEEVGDIGIDQLLQVLGFRLASIGRSQEKRHRRAACEFSQITELKEQLLSKESSLTELKKKLSEVETDLKVERECRENISGLLKKKESDLLSLTDRVVELSAKMKELENNKQGDILDAFAEGFQRAVNQARYLAPDRDFSDMDPGKIVREGKLVDDKETVEEGDENLAD